jgi:hypothetical protein
MMQRLLPALMAALLAVPAMAGEPAPVPRQKPARSTAEQAAYIPVPRPNPRRHVPAHPAAASQAASHAAGSCLAGLARLDVGFERLAPIAEGGCGTDVPLLLKHVRGVALDPPATVTCEMAEALHGWVGDVVQPAAKRRLKTRVTAIRVAASYVCRRRNNQKTGKLSEHARANALDMAGFRFAGAGDATVGDGWGFIPAALGLSKDESFLDDVRKGACAYFTTVLGPGSDSYHGDHFHVDAIHRRGGYRICH